ncbi:MAG: ComEC/Rec2 family competence protein [Syntrophobacteraceae bacterium]
MPARPLFWLTLAFMFGIAADRLIAENLPAGSAPLALAAFILLCISIFPLRLNLGKAQFGLSVLLFVLYGIWAAHSTAIRPPAGLQPFLGLQSVSYVSEVSAPPEYYPDRIRIPLRLFHALADGKTIPLEAGVLLTLSRKNPSHPPTFYLPGDRLFLRTVLKPFRNFRNPGSFDYLQYQAERGLHAQGFIRDERFLIKLNPEHGFSLSSAVNGFRGRIELFRQEALFWFKRSLDPDSVGFYAALVLGYQHQLGGKQQELINRTGLNHLLSVSGLHLGLVSLIVFWLVRLAVRFCHPAVLNRISDKQIAVWPALACAVLYAFLAGFAVPPIWRSILMLAVCFGAGFWYRPADSLTVLALAALVILALDPNSLRQISFQFTFACVLAIILVYPRLQGFRLSRIYPSLGPATIHGKVFSQFEDAFWVSIAVSTLVLPLTVYYFNGFSLAGFVANILLVPYIGFVILPVGLLSVVLFALSETLAHPFILAGGFFLSPALWLIEWFGSLTWSYFWTGRHTSSLAPLGLCRSLLSAHPIVMEGKINGTCRPYRHSFLKLGIERSCGDTERRAPPCRCDRCRSGNVNSGQVSFRADNARRRRRLCG